MKIEIGLTSLAFLAGMTFQSRMTEDHAQEREPAVEWKDWGEDPMNNPEFMAAWMASATPGEAHAKIAMGAGEWTVEQTMYMAPDTEGLPGTATASAEMLLGGRVLLQEYKSDFQGMPMEGLLLLGFDNLSEEYWSIWLDNFSTWPSIARGKVDDKGVVNQVGSMRDVSTPGGRPYRHVSWHDGEDISRAEMFDSLPDGSEFKVMDFTYKRKQ